MADSGKTAIRDLFIFADDEGHYPIDTICLVAYAAPSDMNNRHPQIATRQEMTRPLWSDVACSGWLACRQ